MRKDIKKSSYYVWFLGAQEAKGLRGPEYITPVIRSLVERERDVEPFKVTLQISHKGLKIVQNVPNAGGHFGPAAKAPGKKTEVVKHFIPHHAVTCVLRDEDVVACILLLYNPVTECPVHVHAYRCDSVETATVLGGQLQTLVERPENQKKLAEIEAGLKAKGLPAPSPADRPPRRTRVPGGSDGRSSSTRESESSGGSSSERLSGVGRQERIAGLYDSLAAELREKLGAGGTRAQAATAGRPHAHAPILLPPRDYDTVHRRKGNLSDIDLRRCLNTNIVGVNATSPDSRPSASKHASGVAVAKVGSSGGSSGIGSDHAPSPDQDSDARFLDNRSTSDEDWNADSSKDQSLFLVQSNWKGVETELSLPRVRRADPQAEQEARSHLHLDLEAAAAGQRRRKNAEERQRSPTPPDTPRERFNDAKEKFLSLERERLDEQEKQERAPPPPSHPERRRQNLGAEPPISPAVLPAAFQRSRPTRSWSRSRDSEEDLEGRIPRSRYYQPEDDDIRYLEERDQPTVLRRESMYRKVRSRESLDSEDYHVRPQGRSGYPVQRIEELPQQGHGGYPAQRIEESQQGRGGYPAQRVEEPPQQGRSGHPAQRVEETQQGRGGYPAQRLEEPQQGRGGYTSQRIEEPHQGRGGYPAQRIEESQQGRGGYPAQRIEELPQQGRGGYPSQRIEESQQGRGGYPVQRIEESQQVRSGYPSQRLEEPQVRGGYASQRTEDSHQVRTGYPSQRIEEPRRNARSSPSRRSAEKSYAPQEMQERPQHRRYASPSPPLDQVQAQHGRDRQASPQPRPAPRAYSEDCRSSGRLPGGRGDNIPLERYRSPARMPRPAPRHQRYPSPTGSDKKKSMYESVEDERRRNSNELAKEFKRRSYQELEDHERYPGLDRETAAIGRVQHEENAPRYRHSYAEYHSINHELLHRTNSSVSSGRVGIAAIHPY